MRERKFWIIVLIAFFVFVISFALNLQYLKSSVDHVVFEDVKTVKNVLSSSLQMVLRTQKEQEFYIVKNLLRAEEWLSNNPNFSRNNLKWLVEVTGISGILVLSGDLKPVESFPENANPENILEDFDSNYLKFQDLYPYENDHSVNLASFINGRIVIFFALKKDLREKGLISGTEELLKVLEEDKKISYLALQDTQGIWFGIKVPEDLSDIDEDSDLMKVYKKGKYISRVTYLGDEDILEIAIPFELPQYFNGILRLGISRSYYVSAYKGFVRNLAIIHLILLALVVFVLFFIFTRRKLQIKLLSFDTMLSHIPLGVAVFDRFDNLIFANDDFYKSLKIPKGKAQKLSFSEMFPKVPVLELFSQKDQIKKLRYTFVPIISGENRRVGTLVIVESTELEDRLERAERIELLGEMSAQVAHEIKNPLNSISMIVQRLNSEFVVQPEMEARELLSILSKEIDRIKEIVNRFVSIMSPLKVNWQCTPICELVEEVLSEFLTELRLKEISFRTVYRACPNILIDEEKIKEVLRNVIRNSVEAIAPDGRGFIKVTVLTQGENLMVAISDNGVGMTKDELIKASTPFFTSKAKGSGLGLFFVRKVVEAHGGDLIIKSVKNKGTVVVIILPYAKDRRC